MPTMNRRAAKRDLAEPAIVAALKAAGATVVKLSDRGIPDLLVGYADGNGQQVNTLMEVKTGNASLTDDEKWFFETWRGAAHIVRTPEEALAIIGK